MSYNEEHEKKLEKQLGLKCYTNIDEEYIEKYKKALHESRAIGRIIDYAYDRNGNLDKKKKALYLKNGIEIAKFMYRFNHPETEYIDLSNVPIEDMLNEINKRFNKGLL